MGGKTRCALILLTLLAMVSITAAVGCNSDCTFGSSKICNASCAGINGCTGVPYVCTGGTKGVVGCRSDNYQITCCNVWSACGTSKYCSTYTPFGCTACPAGTANCNNHMTCDVNKNTDPKNCGSCGHVCGTTTCPKNYCGPGNKWCTYSPACSGGICTCKATCGSGCPNEEAPQTPTNSDAWTIAAIIIILIGLGIGYFVLRAALSRGVSKQKKRK